MSLGRDLAWEGCFNVRDLGGLRTGDGRDTRWGAVVRAATLDGLTAAGWSGLHAHGIRTIVDLRNDAERDARSGPSVPDVTTAHVPLDDAADTEVWRHCWDNELDGSPLYYRPFLERKPDRCAAAVAAIARAEPGGVVFHCGAGRDRTGLVTLLLLALVGVAPEDIVADYELSNLRLPPFWAARGEEDQNPRIADILARKGTTASALLLDILASLDVEAHLRSGGLGDGDLAAVRARLVGPPAAVGRSEPQTQ